MKVKDLNFAVEVLDDNLVDAEFDGVTVILSPSPYWTSDARHLPCGSSWVWDVDSVEALVEVLQPDRTVFRWTPGASRTGSIRLLFTERWVAIRKLYPAALCGAPGVQRSVLVDWLKKKPGSTGALKRAIRALA